MITFAASDIKIPKLESLAKDISTAVYKYRNRRFEIDRFLRHTGNTLDRYHHHYKRWSESYQKKTTPADEKEFAELLGRIGTECTSDKEWKKLRGLIAEKIFEPYFINKHSDSTVDFGVKVLINGTEVIYEPENITDTDKKRQSVDAAAWDTRKGEFAEVKFNPEIFEAKDINYLIHLEFELNKHDISHSIVIVTFSDPIVTKNALISKGLLNRNINFEIIGPDTFM